MAAPLVGAVVVAVDRLVVAAAVEFAWQSRQTGDGAIHYYAEADKNPESLVSDRKGSRSHHIRHNGKIKVK